MEIMAKVLSKILLSLLIIAIDVFFPIYKFIVFYNSTEIIPVYDYSKIWTTIIIAYSIKFAFIFLFIISSKNVLSLDYWVSRWIVCFFLVINILFIYDNRIFTGSLEYQINVVPLFLDIAYITYFIIIFIKHIIGFLIKKLPDCME